MATRLVSLKIAHVAGVDRPANKRSFLVVKQEKSIEKQMSVKEEGGKFCLYDGEKKMGEYDSMDAAQAAKENMMKSSAKAESEGVTMLTTQQIGKIDDKELQEAVVAQQEEMLVLQRQLDEAKKNGTIEKAANLEDEEIWKGIPPALRNRVEALKRERDEAAAKAKAESDKRETDVWVGKCQGFRYLQITPEHFGKVMKNIAEACPEDAKEVYRVLEVADNTIDKGHVFAEYGRGAGEPRSYDATNVEARVDAMAEDLQKMDQKLSYEQAIQKVFRQNPDLHKAWHRQSQVKVSAQ